MNRPIVDVYTLAWNEERYIEQFCDWYSFARKITVYDNQSTDKTKQLALSKGCVVQDYGDGTNNDFQMNEVKETCWKNSDADWVIVCDVDEFLYHPNLESVLITTDATIIKPEGYQMVSEVTAPLHTIKKGVRFSLCDKMVCFKPSKITRMNWDYGCHNANPEGSVIIKNEDVKMLHYHLVDRNYLKKRRIESRNRMSEWNRSNGAGSHLFWSDEYFDQYFDSMLATSTEVI